MKYVFFYQNKRYEMTEEQLEAAYRFRLLQYRLQDAKRHLDEFIFGDDPETISDFDAEQKAFEFMEKYKIEPREAYGLLNKIVTCFEHNDDCNLDENSRWENAIAEVLNSR